MGRQDPFATVPQLRTLTAGLGLSGGGDMSANRTFSLAVKQIILGGDFDGILAAATMINAIWDKQVSAAPRIYTTDSAANIILALGAGVGRWFNLTLSAGGAANSLTLAAGAGVTLLGAATNFVLTQESRSFQVVVTGAGTVSIVRL